MTEPKVLASVRECPSRARRSLAAARASFCFGSFVISSSALSQPHIGTVPTP